GRPVRRSGLLGPVAVGGLRRQPPLSTRERTQVGAGTMHPLRKYKLNRRTMLRGMVGGGAVTVGLPLLEVMLNESGTALADGSALPTRFMTWYWADGVVLDLWEPQGGNAAAGVHPNWELSTQLQPLAPV